jgi:NAD-dependent deacetylase
MPEAAPIARVRHLMSGATTCVVLTGAGMSAESGIPTFRDAQTGYWSRFDPMELASEEGFRAQPQRVWDWYAQRRQGVLAAAPNAGHLALAAFERRRPGVLRVITQNVDDLHQQAGQTGVIRLHGDILQDRWLDPCPRESRGKGCDATGAQPGRPPGCQECGNLVRPGVVWFGEPIPAAALDAAEAAIDATQLLLVVGTSGTVWPAAGLAVRARRNGATVAVVNPHPSELDEVAHHVLRGTAARLLPELLA